jgi:hypothetical protein
MNIKKMVLLAIMVAAFCSFIPVNAQTAIFDSVSSPETAAPGAVVSVDLVISYDCDMLTMFSPGVYDLIAESYLAEEGFEVTGTGKESTSLQFNAPDIEGEYVFIVDMYFNNGTDTEFVWQYAGQENYYITLTVQQGGGVSDPPASAVVSDVKHPSIVKPGAPIEVEVTVDYDFTATTNMEVAVTNQDTMEAIQTASAVKSGVGTEKFKLTVYAPDQEGTYNLGADVIFETINGWEFSSGGAMAFTVEVDSNASSGGIPGFPVASAILGALLVIGFLQYSGRKAPLF